MQALDFTRPKEFLLMQEFFCYTFAMNFILACAWTSLVLSLTAGFINSAKIVKHQVEPTLSTWIIFLSGTSTSFLSFLVSSNRNFVGGVLNGADVIIDVLMILSIIFFGIVRWQMKSFEKYYLSGLIVIIIFWLLTRDSFHSNLLTQVLLGLAYIPTIHTIIKVKRNTESFVVWGMILLSSFISLYPAFNSWQVDKNALALIYSVRSIILISALIIVMVVYRPPHPALKTV